MLNKSGQLNTVIGGFDSTMCITKIRIVKGKAWLRLRKNFRIRESIIYIFNIKFLGGILTP